MRSSEKDWGIFPDSPVVKTNGFKASESVNCSVMSDCLQPHGAIVH